MEQTKLEGTLMKPNSLSYEELTNLDDMITVLDTGEYSSRITFNDNDIIFVKTVQSNLFKYMEDEINITASRSPDYENPDECYINHESKTLFVVEKKFQQCCEFDCEQIQNTDFKLWYYGRTFPNYNIVYIYCLSEWFKKNCKAKIEYLIQNKINIFWGDSDTYKNDIINFMINYK